MKNIGVICEYNPFHLGHLDQIRRIRDEFPSCRVICAMSGAFVQRGERAIFDKYDRAHAALACGVDLLLELPYPYSASSAETFAQAGVSVLDAARCDVLCFGSECGDADLLKTVAACLDSPELLCAMEQDETKNESYVMKLRRHYERIFGSGFPITPNDILAVCYLRAMRAQNSKMQIFTYKRRPGYSATRARQALRDGENARFSSLIPQAMLDATEGKRPISPLLPPEMILSFLRLYRGDIEDLRTFDGISPGIPTAMQNAALRAGSTEDLVRALTTRTDTAAKVRRSIFACLTGATREDVRALPTFTLLLGANGRGREHLAALRKAPRIDILTSLSDGARLTGQAKSRFDLFLRAEYLSATANGIVPADLYKKTPVILP